MYPISTKTVTVSYEISFKGFRRVSDEDLHFGLRLYFVLTYCSVEDFKLFLFHKNLVDSASIRTIVQAAKNNINSRNVKKCENQWRMKAFFKELSEVLELNLGGILRAISTEAQLQGLNEKELPYLNEENMTQFSLQTGMCSKHFDKLEAMMNHLNFSSIKSMCFRIS